MLVCKNGNAAWRISHFTYERECRCV